jgi:hypothetical protein
MKPKIHFDESKFRELWAAGERCRDIGAAFGASAAWASRRAMRMRLPRRTTNTGQLPGAAIERAYLEGQTVRQIHAQLAPKFPTLGTTTILDLLRSRKVPLRPRSISPDQFDVSAAVRMARAGLSTREIGKRLRANSRRVMIVVRKVMGKRPNGWFRREFDHARMWSLLRSGMRPAEVARAVGCTPQAIYWHRRQAGMTQTKSKAVSA